METTTLYWGYIGPMENEVETNSILGMYWDTGKEDGNYCLGFRQVRATFRAHVDFESEASHMRDLRRLPPGLLSGMVVSLSQALPSHGCFHVLGSHQQKGNHDSRRDCCGDREGRSHEQGSPSTSWYSILCAAVGYLIFSLVA